MGPAHHYRLRSHLPAPGSDANLRTGRSRRNERVAGADSGERDAWQSVASGHVLAAARQLQSRIFQHAHALVYRRLPRKRLGAATLHRVLHILRRGRRTGDDRHCVYPFSWRRPENGNRGRIWRHFRPADGVRDSLRRSGDVLVSAAVPDQGEVSGWHLGGGCDHCGV